MSLRFATKLFPVIQELIEISERSLSHGLLLIQHLRLSSVITFRMEPEFYLQNADKDAWQREYWKQKHILQPSEKLEPISSVQHNHFWDRCLFTEELLKFLLPMISQHLRQANVGMRPAEVGIGAQTPPSKHPRSALTHLLCT